MRNKIAFKLSLYFASALLIFALIIGGIFIALFRNHTINAFRDDLKARAMSIADTLSEYSFSNGVETGNRGMGNGGIGGYGSYLRFVDDIAMTDVWIVDENLDLITAGKAGNIEYNYADLPEDAESVVKSVFDGNTTFSESFSGLLDAPTLTVGTPIIVNGEIIGAVLLHSPVQGIDEATRQGMEILLFSILIALILAVILSVFFALTFTRPLKKMKNSALLLADGDYNVTTGVQQNDEIGELADTIDILSEKLKEAKEERDKLEHLRRDFIANISHELRTPVTVMRGSLEALCDEVVNEPEQVKSYHCQMLIESRSLERLINDLLDLSRLQNCDFKIEMEDINLFDILSDAVRSARQMARDKNIEVVLESDGQPLPYHGDYSRLRQMFLIVLNNAIKFSPHNSKVSVLVNDKIISIDDQGPGINKTDLPHIFDRFYKVDSKENKEGSGLGLAIAKQIADRHDIRLTVESQAGKGTVFQFHIG